MDRPPPSTAQLLSVARGTISSLEYGNLPGTDSSGVNNLMDVPAVRAHLPESLSLVPPLALAFSIDHPSLTWSFTINM
jgi:hypothetical protein